MPAAQRDTLAEAALAIATTVRGGDVAQVRALYDASPHEDAVGTQFQLGGLAAATAGGLLRVTQLYLLDATARKDTTTSADFSCALTDSTAETDFSINGLPAGTFAFAMVESAGGAQPWLISLLLSQSNATSPWRLTNFFPRPRTAAGHDGLWYWTTARERTKAKQPWAAWLLYGEAVQLLQPAAFVSSTHLDALLAERHSAAPPELGNGVSADAPYVLVSKGEFHFTDVSVARSDDGQRLLLVLHLRAESVADAAAARARNLAAATAFVDAHPEVRSVAQSVTVFSDAPGAPPFATQHGMTEIQ